MTSKLRKCPLCNHNTAELIERGIINKYPDGKFKHFNCTSYIIHCKACEYRIERENMKDVILSWNMDNPTLENYQWYVNHGIYLKEKWEEQQDWLPANK